VPLRTARSVVDPREAKVERLARLATESAKQCGRAWLMRVAATVELGKVLRQTCDLGLVMDPGGEAVAGLPGRLRDAGRVVLIVGPEGGLTEAELRESENAGFARWSVGPHVLRVETAACVGAGVLRYLAMSGGVRG